MRSKKIAILLCATTVVLALGLVPSVRAYAAGGGDGCNPHRGVGNDKSQFDGWQNDHISTTTVGGAYANIYNYSPWVSANTSQGSNEIVVAWTMLTDGTNYAQVGWWEYAGTHGSPQRNVFVEINSNGSDYQQLFTAQTQDTSTYYTTLFTPNGSGGTLSFQVAGSTLGGIPSAYTTVSWTPHHSQIYGEVHNVADQMPGDQRAGKFETFEDSSYYAGGAWHAYYGDVNTHAFDDQPTDWGQTTALETGKGGTLSDWDWACPLHETAFQDNTGNLHTYDVTGGVGYLQPMAGGTNPGITATSGGGWVVAYQDNTTNLHIYTSGGTSYQVSLGMKSGTSPSITALSNGTWVVAGQINTGAMFTYTSGGAATNTGQGMLAGTSPSITAIPSAGWEIAFQANTGNLYTYSSGGTSTNRGLGMLSGTSPNITTLSGGSWIIAFQANTSSLWTLTSGGTATNRNQGMAAGTSPSIAGTAGGGWVVAFHANTGTLYTYDSNSTSSNTSQAMYSGTSPSITTMGNGFGWEIAINDQNTDLRTYNSFGAGLNTALGMATTTSPSNASPS